MGAQFLPHILILISMIGYLILVVVWAWSTVRDHVEAQMIDGEGTPSMCMDVAWDLWFQVEILISNSPSKRIGNPCSTTVVFLLRLLRRMSSGDGFLIGIELNPGPKGSKENSAKEKKEARKKWDEFNELWKTGQKSKARSLAHSLKVVPDWMQDMLNEGDKDAKRRKNPDVKTSDQRVLDSLQRTADENAGRDDADQALSDNGAGVGDPDPLPAPPLDPVPMAPPPPPKKDPNEDLTPGPLKNQSWEMKKVDYGLLPLMQQWCAQCRLGNIRNLLMLMWLRFLWLGFRTWGARPNKDGWIYTVCKRAWIGPKITPMLLGYCLSIWILSHNESLMLRIRTGQPLSAMDKLFACVYQAKEMAIRWTRNTTLNPGNEPDVCVRSFLDRGTKVTCEQARLAIWDRRVEERHIDGEVIIANVQPHLISEAVVQGCDQWRLWDLGKNQEASQQSMLRAALHCTATVNIPVGVDGGDTYCHELNASVGTQLYLTDRLEKERSDVLAPSFRFAPGIQWLSSDTEPTKSACPRGEWHLAPCTILPHWGSLMFKLMLSPAEKLLQCCLSYPKASVVTGLTIVTLLQSQMEPRNASSLISLSHQSVHSNRCAGLLRDMSVNTFSQSQWMRTTLSRLGCSLLRTLIGVRRICLRLGTRLAEHTTGSTTSLNRSLRKKVMMSLSTLVGSIPDRMSLSVFVDLGSKLLTMSFFVTRRLLRKSLSQIDRRTLWTKYLPWARAMVVQTTPHMKHISLTTSNYILNSSFIAGYYIRSWIHQLFWTHLGRLFVAETSVIRSSFGRLLGRRG
jgi:hypothetical protein